MCIQGDIEYMVKVVVLIEWKGSISYLFQVGIIRYEKYIIGCFH